MCIYKKKAEVITEKMEKILWQKGLLGWPVTTRFTWHDGVFKNTQKQKLELIPESAEKKSDVAGSENTAQEYLLFAKPLSIPGIQFGTAASFTINLNFGQ